MAGSLIPHSLENLCGHFAVYRWVCVPTRLLVQRRVSALGCSPPKPRLAQLPLLCGRDRVLQNPSSSSSAIGALPIYAEVLTKLYYWLRVRGNYAAPSASLILDLRELTVPTAIPNTRAASAFLASGFSMKNLKSSRSRGVSPAARAFFNAASRAANVGSSASGDASASCFSIRFTTALRVTRRLKSSL